MLFFCWRCHTSKKLCSPFETSEGLTNGHLCMPFFSSTFLAVVRSHAPLSCTAGYALPYLSYSISLIVRTPLSACLFVCLCLCCGLISFQSTVIPLYEPLHYYKCKFCTSAVVALYFILFLSHFVNDPKNKTKHKGVQRTCPHMKKQTIQKQNYELQNENGRHAELTAFQIGLGVLYLH